MNQERIITLTWLLEELFYKFSNLNMLQIKQNLECKGLSYTIDEINLAISILMVVYGKIVRDDFWSTEPVYKYISNRYFQNSSYTRHYYSFNVDDYNNKKFLLISDTHIGNPELENFQMLQNIYNFAISNGVNKCFHLGDIFSGSYYEKWSRDEMQYQLNLFVSYYPKNSEIKTYSLIGNHDESLHGYFEYKKSYEKSIYDLRQLSKFVQNFYVMPRDTWEATFSNINVKFSHRLFLNWMVRDKKLNCLDEIEEDNIFYTDTFNMLISGHLHRGFVLNNKVEGKDQLLLGVPSATNININGVVAYIISLNYNDFGNVDSADITLLLCDNNNKITSGETINWNFKKENKKLKRIF